MRPFATLATFAALAAALSLAGTAVAAVVVTPVKVAFKPATPQPKVGVKWPYKLVVTSGGKPARGRLTVTLVDPIGQVHPVEDDADDKPIKNRAFTGTFKDKILFPAEARGFTLTLRFAVTVGTAKTVKVVKVTPR